MASGELLSVVRHLRKIVQPDGPDSVTDAQLLERFLVQHDESAFELLLWRHGAMVMGLCRRVLRREQDVEDAFQATFLVLVRKARSISKRQALGSWLYKVAYRVALGAKIGSDRRAAREVPLSDVPAVESDAVWRDLAPLLDEGVSRLPEKYRTPFILCYFQGKSLEETAALLGCPKGTIGTRLARARERLRKDFAARGLSVGAAALAVALSEKAARATAGAPLVAATVRVAKLFGAGPAGAVSARVVHLTEGALRSMFLLKIKTALAVTLMLFVLGSGVGGLAFQLHAAEEPPGAPKPATAPPVKPPKKVSEAIDDAILRKLHDDFVVPNYDHGGKIGVKTACVACHVDPFADWLNKDAKAERTVVKGWGATIDPDEDCKFTIGKDTIKIALPGKDHALAIDRKQMNAPRVLQPIEGNFIVQVKVAADIPVGTKSLVKTRRPFHGAGLVLWVNDQNYIRLERAEVAGAGGNANYANFEYWKDGNFERMGTSDELPLTGKTVYLRLERRDAKVIASISADGVNWTAMDPIDVKLPAHVQVGVVAGHNTSSGFEVEFSGLKLFREVDR